MNTPKLVIFDCDGVLVDSEPLNELAVLSVLDRIGIRIDSDVYRHTLQGLTNEAVAELIAEQWGAELPTDFGDLVVPEERRLMLDQLQAVPGVEDALTSIVKSEMEICVASNGPPEAIADRLDITGLKRFFPGRMFSADQVPRGKPHPDLFILAAESLGFAPSDCVVMFAVIAWSLILLTDSNPGIDDCPRG